MSWTLLGDVIYAGCQWGMLIVLAKLGSPEMVGQFALGFAVTAPVIIFANLTLRPIQATDVRDEYAFADYYTLRLLTTGAALLVIGGIVLQGSYDHTTRLVILAVGMAKAVEALSDVFHGLLQRHERLDTIARAKIIKGLLSLILFTVGIYWTGNVVWGAVGFMAAWAVVLIGYDARYGVMIINGSSGGPVLWPRRPSRKMWQLVRVAWPLGLSTMFVSLNDAIPRYAIAYYLGNKELGIYAAMAYMPAAGMMVANALGQSSVTRMARQFVEGSHRGFLHLLFQITALAAAVGGAGIVTVLLGGRDILTWAYQTEYANRADVFLWLMVVMTIGYMASILGYGLIAARLIKIQPVVLAASLIVGTVCCYAWIPTLGIKGAAWGYGAAFLTQLTGFCIYTAIHARTQRTT